MEANRIYRVRILDVKKVVASGCSYESRVRGDVVEMEEKIVASYWEVTPAKEFEGLQQKTKILRLCGVCLAFMGLICLKKS